MRSFSLLALLFGVLALSGVPNARGDNALGCPLMIDDFTQGALPPANGPFEFTHVGLPEQSCAGGSRRVWINDVATHSAGMILVGSDIAFKIQTEEHAPGNNVVDDADVALHYDMAETLDLTVGGRNDRMIIQVLSVSFIDVFVQFSHPGGSVAKTVPLSPGANVILFSEFNSLIDFTAITKVAFYFNEFSTSGLGELTMSRIRVTGSGKRPLYMQVPELIEIAPPYLLPGPLMEGIYVDEGRSVQTLSTFISLDSGFLLPIGPNGPTPFPVERRTADNAVEGAPGGLAAGFEVVDAQTLKRGSLQEGVFEITFALEEAGEHVPIQTIIEDPQNPTLDVFYIPFRVELIDTLDQPAGFLSYRLRVQVPPEVGYDLRNIAFFPAKSSGPQFTVQFELRADGTSSPVPAQPLFLVSLEGDYEPYFQSTATPLWREETTVLSAWPSVVSDRTVLRWDRPLDLPGVLRVHDLAGRLVRELPVAAGPQGLIWDTRDDRGIAVASGVYVARLEAGSTRATRKLVVVR